MKLEGGENRNFRHWRTLHYQFYTFKASIRDFKILPNLAI